MNTTVGSISSLADSAIPNMFTTVSSSNPTSETISRWFASPGNTLPETRRARREADGDRQYVVDHERGGRQQCRNASEIALGDRVGAAPVGMRRDHLRVGHDEQREHARDHERQRDRVLQGAGARRDEHEHHRLGSVRDARQSVEAQRREPTANAQVVALLGMLAYQRSARPAGVGAARASDASSRSPPPGRGRRITPRFVLIRVGSSLLWSCFARSHQQGRPRPYSRTCCKLATRVRAIRRAVASRARG